MKRNFKDFLTAYETYANDSFVPPQFNTWTGLSVIAGALERKVWLPWNDTFSMYPNIFVLLVSLPGVGKSTALNKGMDLLREMNLRDNALNLLPTQVTEAQFITEMANAKPFELGTRIIQQSSGFYFASEASNSLKNIYGDFIACLTDFYDCPTNWDKSTKKDGRVSLRNVLLNLLAGSTFDYLNKLVSDENIMGGFASRLIYVVHREKLVRNQKFQLGGMNPQETTDREEFRRFLLADLFQINKLVGKFTADKAFGEAWEKWYPEFEERRQSHPSEKMQSLLVRTNTNILKTSMLMSASESNDMVLRAHHWEKARALCEVNEKELPNIFRIAKSQDTTTQAGLLQAILNEFVQKGPQNLGALRSNLTLRGFYANKVEEMLKAMEAGGKFETISASGNGRVVKLLGDANNHL